MTAPQAQGHETNHAIYAGDAADQYLTFMLATEEYGVEILRVQEIKGWEQTTPMPNTPEHVLGVINIRGEIVPIIDLRERFGLKRAPHGPMTVVVVVKLVSDEKERTVGLVVDAVADVYRLDKEQLQPSPELGDGISSDCIKGLATIDNKMVLIIDVDELIDFSAITSPARSPIELAHEFATQAAPKEKIK